MMKSFLIVLSSIAPTVLSMALDQRATCGSDNCGRAVFGTAPGNAVSSSHIAQCSSYFATTIIPPTTTISTAVATSYVFSTASATSGAASSVPVTSTTSTTITPTNLPNFATTACASSKGVAATARYSSACSCAGVSHSTTILAAPSTTVSYTTTVTVSSFLLQASGGPLATPEYIGTSGLVYGYDNSNTVGFTTDVTQAATFVIAGQQLEIMGTDLLSDDDETAVTEPLFFDSASTISASGYAAVDVTVGPDLSVVLSNTYNGDSIPEDCGGLLDLGPTAGGNDALGNSCQVVTLMAVPL